MITPEELFAYGVILTCELGRDIIDRKAHGDQSDTGAYEDWPMMLRLEIGNVRERMRQP